MTILQHLGTQLQSLFPANEHGQERAQWFLLALQSILLPITASRTSNLLRTIATVFGWHLDQTRFYTFMVRHEVARTFIKELDEAATRRRAGTP